MNDLEVAKKNISYFEQSTKILQNFVKNPSFSTNNYQPPTN